tara:strand:- start:148 stop:372 length:225 start_codon:yes stop_codon:yes gene_type:complete
MEVQVVIQVLEAAEVQLMAQVAYLHQMFLQLLVEVLVVQVYQLQFQVLLQLMLEAEAAEPQPKHHQLLVQFLHQ